MEDEPKHKVDFASFVEEQTTEHRIIRDAIFGCPDQGEIGMKKKVDDLYLLMTGGTWAWKILVSIIILLGTIVAVISGIRKI